MSLIIRRRQPPVASQDQGHPANGARDGHEHRNFSVFAQIQRYRCFSGGETAPEIVKEYAMLPKRIDAHGEQRIVEVPLLLRRPGEKLLLQRSEIGKDAGPYKEEVVPLKCWIHARERPGNRDGQSGDDAVPLSREDAPRHHSHQLHRLTPGPGPDRSDRSVSPRSVDSLSLPSLDHGTFLGAMGVG